MGLFSTETKIYVGTSVVRVLEDAQYISPLRAAIIAGTVKPTDLVDEYMENLFNGLGIRGKAYYNQGRNDYVYGVPKGTAVSPASGAAEVQEAIETEVGAAVTLAYSFFGLLNYPHMALQEIDTAYGLVYATGELEALTASHGGNTTTLTKITITVPAATFDAIPASGLKSPAGMPCALQFLRDTVGSDVKVSVDYTWTVLELVGGILTPVVHTGSSWVTTSMPIPGYSAEQDFFHAAYILSGDTKFWRYRLGDETYPALDSLFDVGFTENGSYFPWVYLRYDATRQDLDPSSTAYKQSTKLCKRLGLNYQELIDSVHEQSEIGDVQQALLWFAVPPVSTDLAELTYLYAYWQEAYASQGGEITLLSRSAFNAAFTESTVNSYSNVIRDDRLVMSLTHAGIWKRTVTGSIGAVGTLKTETGALTTETPYTNSDGATHIKYTGRPCHYYMKQVTETTYEEIQVISLTFSYWVYRDAWSTGNLTTGADILYLPLDMAIVENMPGNLREKLLYKNIRMVFNSMVMEKVDWYEGFIFRGLLVAVGVVLSIFGMVQIGAKLIAIFGSGTLAAAAVLTLSLILEFAFYQQIFKFIVKVIGENSAVAVALIIIAHRYFKGGFTSLAEFLKDGFVQFNLSLIKAVGESYKTMALEIQKELLDLRSAYEKEMDALEKVWKEMQASPIMEYMIFPGESVATFKARTGNPVEVLQMATGNARDFVKQMRYIPTPIVEEYTI